MSDIICAISTALGEGAIGIIRISGSGSEDVLNRVFSFKNPRQKLENRKLYFGHVVDSESREIIDEAMAVFTRAPLTYTGEDMAEIHAHGGIASMKLAMEEVLRAGARIAEPGEFTKRAFINGKLDLMQAESIADIIRAKTRESLAAAHKQKKGFFSEKIGRIKTEILEWLYLMEAHIDFCEEDLPRLDLSKFSSDVLKWKEEIADLIKQAKRNRIYKEGLDIVIAGKPNVGKSSIFNSLVDEERAIVTEIPGTTRDRLEKWISLGGIPVKLTDTAGIRKSDDIVEKIGIKGTLGCIREADLVLLILDSSGKIADDDREVFNAVGDKPCVVFMNKADLGSIVGEEEIAKYFNRYDKAIYTSVITGAGIKEAREVIFDLSKKWADLVIEGLSARVGCESALKEAESFLANIEKSLRNGMALDFITVDIMGALHSLGKITGETTPEDIINEIFSRFCIGK